jgi:ankyrin repeat protein
MAAESTAVHSIIPLNYAKGARDSDESKLALREQARRFHHGNGALKDPTLAAIYYLEVILRAPDEYWDIRWGCYGALCDLNEITQGKNPYVLYALGCCFFHGCAGYVSNHLDKAQDYFWKAHQLQPTETWFMGGMVMLYVSKKGYKLNSQTPYKMHGIRWAYLAALCGSLRISQELKDFLISDLPNWENQVSMSDQDSRCYVVSTHSFYYRYSQDRTPSVGAAHLGPAMLRYQKYSPYLPYSPNPNTQKNLQEMIAHDYIHTARELIAHGTSLKKPEDGPSFLDLAKKKKLLWIISLIQQQIYQKVLQRLANKDAVDLITPLEITQQPPLASLIQIGAEDLAIQIFNQGASLATQATAASTSTNTTTGETLLHLAASNHCLEVLRALGEGTSLRSQVHQKNNAGNTALHEAAYMNHVDVIKLLRSAPYELTELNIKNKEGLTLLHIAAKQGHQALCEYLLTQPEIDIDTLDWQRHTPYTPFELAILNGHTHLAHLLLLNGATPIAIALPQASSSTNSETVISSMPPFFKELEERHCDASLAISQKITTLPTNSPEVKALRALQQLILQNPYHPLFLIFEYFMTLEIYKAGAQASKEPHSTFLQAFALDKRSDLEKFVDALIPEQDKEYARKQIIIKPFNFSSLEKEISSPASTSQESLHVPLLAATSEPEPYVHRRINIQKAQNPTKTSDGSPFASWVQDILGSYQPAGKGEYFEDHSVEDPDYFVSPGFVVDGERAILRYARESAARQQKILQSDVAVKNPQRDFITRQLHGLHKDPICFDDDGNTLLHIIAQYDFLLLDLFWETELRRYINFTNRYGNTPFLTAAAYGSMNAMQWFIDHGSVDPLTAKNHLGDTALHLAARNGHIDVCTFLVKQGADLSAQNLDGDIPLHLAAHAKRSSPYGTPVSAVAQMLLANGADPMARNNNQETCLDSDSLATRLLRQALEMEHRNAQRILQEKKATLLASANSEELQSSIQKDFEQVITFIKSYPSRPLCIIIAAYKEQPIEIPPEIIQLLDDLIQTTDRKYLFRSSDLANIISHPEILPSQLTSRPYEKPIVPSSYDAHGFLTTFIQFTNKAQECKNPLLTVNRDFYSVTENEDTLLHLLARENTPEQGRFWVKHLLETSILAYRVLHKNHAGETPFLSSMQNTSDNIFRNPRYKTLHQHAINNGESIEDIFSPDNQGNTPLHIAVTHGDFALIDYILQHQPIHHIYQQNINGETALDVCINKDVDVRYWGGHGTPRLLMLHGAKLNLNQEKIWRIIENQIKKEHAKIVLAIHKEIETQRTKNADESITVLQALTAYLDQYPLHFPCVIIMNFIAKTPIACPELIATINKLIAGDQKSIVRKDLALASIHENYFPTECSSSETPNNNPTSSSSSSNADSAELDLHKHFLEYRKIPSASPVRHLWTNQLALLLFGYRLDPLKLDEKGNSLLHLAATTDIPVISLLLKTSLKDHISDRNNLGLTPFLIAVGHNSLSAMKDLYAANEDVARDLSGVNKNTPLHLAVMHGHFNACNFLISTLEWLPSDNKNKKGDTPLHLAFHKKPISHDIVELLLLNGCDPTLENQAKENCITASQKLTEPKRTKTLSTLNKKIETSTGNSKKTLEALVRCIQAHQARPCSLVILAFTKTKIYKTATTSKPSSSFSMFRSDSRAELARFINGLIDPSDGKLMYRNPIRLIEKLEKLLSSDSKEQLSFSHMVEAPESTPSSAIPAAEPSCSSSNSSAIEKEPDTLLTAAQQNNVRLMEHLYQAAGNYGGNLLALSDLDENTALHLAAKLGCREATIFLLKNAARHDLQNKDMETPLHLAMRENKQALVELLLLHDADPYIKNKDGMRVWELNSLAISVFNKIEVANEQKTLLITKEFEKLKSMKSLTEEQKYIRDVLELFQITLTVFDPNKRRPFSAILIQFMNEDCYKRLLAVCKDKTIPRLFTSLLDPAYRQYFPNRIPPTLKQPTSYSFSNSSLGREEGDVESLSLQHR